MTVICTETHLTSNPVYSPEGVARFTIALSALDIECIVHRQENVDYLRAGQFLEGDLVQITGALVTSSSGGRQFIKVTAISLTPKDGFNNCKKRKLEAQPCSTSTSGEVGDTFSTFTQLRNHGIYQETNMDTTQLLFMYYGQATFLLEKYNSWYENGGKTCISTENNALVHSKFETLHSIFNLIYEFSLDLTQTKVMNYVKAVRSYVEKLMDVKEAMSDVELPPGLYISQQVLLPSHIYQSYIGQ